jgi:Helicase conserved C-terminal domain
VSGPGIAEGNVPAVAESDGVGVVELLAGAPAAHRRAVAAQLGLAPAASVEEIAAVLCDPEHMAAAVGALTPAARRLAAEAAFLDEGVVQQSWGGRVAAAVAELERHGIVFTFGGTYNLEHWVPSELRPLLAAALAAPYAGRLAAAGPVATAPARWLDAPLQLAHDVASLWAYLARSPVRVKADGIVYQRDVPKLLDALPPFELHGPHDVMEGPRLGLVLALLRDERLVRVRVDDRPGAGGRRDLVAAGDPLTLLSAEPGRLRRRIVAHARRSVLGALAGALAGVLEPGTVVTLESFGAALRALCEDAGVGVPETSDFGLGLGGVHFAWLAGEVVIGLGENGMPASVRMEPAALPACGRIVCQPNFELVALAPPRPAERLVLALSCEPVSGQAHVFRLTRASVQGAQRSGVLEGGVIAALERVVGELPQNVARSLSDWCASVHRPLRLRTAMLIDTGDPGIADALLAGGFAAHVVERLGPSQLAIPAENLKAVETALRREGRTLEPGIDRLSGRFSEREPVRTEAELHWEPDTSDNRPQGRQVSTLQNAPASPAPVSAILVSPGGSPGNAAHETEDPIDAVLDAIERGTDLFIVYAGAEGITERQITPYEVEGAAVQAYCHSHGEERSFWLASIQEAVAVG